MQSVEQSFNQLAQEEIESQCLHLDTLISIVQSRDLDKHKKYELEESIHYMKSVSVGSQSLLTQYNLATKQYDNRTRAIKIGIVKELHNIVIDRIDAVFGDRPSQAELAKGEPDKILKRYIQDRVSLSNTIQNLKEQLVYIRVSEMVDELHAKDEEETFTEEAVDSADVAEGKRKFKPTM